MSGAALLCVELSCDRTISQGGLDEELRRRSCESLVALGYWPVPQDEARRLLCTHAWLEDGMVGL